MISLRANLVAVALLSLVAAIFLPSALASMRSKSRRMQCSDNLRKITLGIDQYVSAGDYYPPVITRVPRNHGWLASVLPFVGEEDLFESYDFSAHWCDPVNASVIETRVPMFECPSASYEGRMAVGETQFPYRGGVLDYLATNRVSPVMVNDGWLPKSTRIDGILTRQRSVHRSEIRDGLANTILLAEVAGTPAKYVFRQKEPRPMYGDRGFGAWADAGIYIQGHGHQADGRDWPGFCAINCTNDDAIYSFHQGGANLSFADGAVRFVSEQVDLYVLMSAITRDNGELMNREDLPILIPQIQ